MPAKRILQLGDPLLRAVSTPVAAPRDALLVLRDLEATLHEFRRAHGFGRGISAIQVGVPIRVIYLEVEGVRYELINPEFTFQSEGKFTLWDDCFSFPNLMVRLERHTSIRLKHQTPAGETREIAASGALSELIQHEMDHLDGILAVDRALPGDSLSTREEWRRRYAP